MSDRPTIDPDAIRDRMAYVHEAVRMTGEYGPQKAAYQLGNDIDALLDERESLRAALAELVRLKAIKETDPEQHERLKAAAWWAARAALNAPMEDGR